MDNSINKSGEGVRTEDLGHISSTPLGAVDVRVDQFWAEKNEWKKINGGCAISPDKDLEKTLKLLAENISPKQENLAEMVRVSVEKQDSQGRKLAEIWGEKIAQGVNIVGIQDGVFHFYKDSEILAEDNKPLRISAMPAVLQLREKEKAMVSNRIREAILALREDIQKGGGAVTVNDVGMLNAAGQVRLSGGTDVS